MTEDLPKPRSEQDQITLQARSEYDAGLLYRHAREKEWQLIEDAYFNRVKKTLKGRFNIPVPIIPGFVDTWQGKMAKHTTLKFKQQESADYKATQKTTSFYAAQKNKDDYDWDMADTDGKKLAVMSGRAIYSYMAVSKPKYKSILDQVDHYDFICDPIGGGHLENHRFVQRDNIFKDKETIKAGVADGLYEQAQVERLINATSQDMLVDTDNKFRSKQNRFSALKMDGLTHNYAGQSLYKLIEAGTTWKGKRYYVLFNYETGIWLRCRPLEEVFKSNLWWFTSWATHRDNFNFWSKSPCDDMLPMSEMIRVLVNQEFDNRNKRNYGQRAYDPEMFDDPSELEWRQDGLVAVKSGTSRVQQIASGIYQFETPELQGTINLVEWIDGMLKEKTGVNSEAQGQSEESKVGIAYLNVQQSAERTALTYESYVKCWQSIGRRFLWGLWEHMRAPMAVEIIGEQGAEWDEIARREIKTDWDIIVEGGMDEAQQDAIQTKQLTEMFATLPPDELAVTSPKWRVKTKLQAIGVDEDDIRMAFDLEGDQNKEILSEASLMIQDCLEGRPYKLNRGATPAFCQKILDYATDTDLPMAEYQKLMALVEAHLPIAQENMARKAVQMRAQAGVPPIPGQQAPGSLGPAPMPASSPVPGTAGATASMSQDVSNAAPAAPLP
jgi:hypothetical protein